MTAAVFGAPKLSQQPAEGRHAVLLAGHPIGSVGCLGGWCRIRETCPRYHATTARLFVERACEPGHDGLARIAFRPHQAATNLTTGATACS